MNESGIHGWRRATSVARRLLAITLGPLLFSSPAIAQSRGAAALEQMVDGLGVSARVLMIAAHPDDEDTALLTALARGRGAETAYLSLTRGEGGQNGIGPELKDALGLLRSEELLAARRLDGAQQFFTRAIDWGFSKNADEAFRMWPRDELLADVVADPAERHNLAGDPAHRELLAGFRERVMQHASGALEPAFIPVFSPDEAPEFLPPKIGG